MKAVQVALVAIFLYACASQTTPPQEETSKAEDSQTEQAAENSKKTERVARAERKYICRRERATGTHMTTTRCRTRKQVEEERQEARRIMDDTRIFNDQPTATPQ